MVMSLNSCLSGCEFDSRLVRYQVTAGKLFTLFALIKNGVHHGGDLPQFLPSQATSVDVVVQA